MTYIFKRCFQWKTSQFTLHNKHIVVCINLWCELLEHATSLYHHDAKLLCIC